MKPIFVLTLSLSFFFTYSQEFGFPFGQPRYSDHEMKIYDKDSSAIAVVLNEFGYGSMDNDNEYNLLFDYHVRIKILKQEGVERANIEIPLHKNDGRNETIRSIKASSFNIDNGTIKETKVDPKSIFTENNNKYWDVKKFAIPNVREGTVIEYQYVLESPFKFNFRTWHFQEDIPKVKSEFWATIPGNYNYNITLRGMLPLKKHDSEVISQCFYNGKADCARHKFLMTDIPAFVEEDYMTAKSNFLSAIHFELAEFKGFDGRVLKYTKEWKDVDLDLRRDEKFGQQLRKGKDIVDEHIELAMLGETDPLVKAQKIYEFIKNWYQWDEVYGMFSEFGIKKAFNSKKGNVGDINLTLIAALRYAGLDANPVILSTRSNGLPIDIHPVISDFNYVVARLTINEKIYMLDATDDFMPFGLLPLRCFNGKGRVLADKESYWEELKPIDKAKQVSVLNLKLGKDGIIRGTIAYNYYGYEAISKRKEIAKFSTEEAYLTDLKSKLHKTRILKAELTNLNDITKSLSEKFEVEIETFENLDASNLIINPFIESLIKTNPFKSKERLFPVDFGIPIDESIIMSLEYPDDLVLTETPEKLALALPNAGGRYLFSLQNVGNKILLNNALTVTRILYSSEEYHYLKELYSRILQVQNTSLVFKKNKG